MTNSQLRITPDWNIPLYMQIFEKIRDMILSGTLKPGEKLPVSRELQRDLHLSSFTVEKGVRLLVEKGWLVRRSRIGTFVAEHLPENSVGLPREMDNGLIRVVFEKILPFGDYWFALLLSLESALRKAGFRLELCQITAAYSPSANDLAAYCSGLIFCGTCSSTLVRNVARNRVPLVLLGSLDRPRTKLPGIDMLVHDDKQYSFEGMKHLLELGHRRILCITAPAGTQFHEHLLAGIRKAARLYQLDESTLWIVSLPTASVPEGVAAAKKTLCMDSAITAILSTDTMLTIGILNAVRDLGLRIPEDISLLNLGNSLHMQDPSVTIVTQNAGSEVFADFAVRRLVAQIKDKKHFGTRIVLGEVSLDIRKSTRFLKYGTAENKFPSENNQTGGN